MLLLFATDVLSLSGIFYTFSSSHSPLCSSHPWAELPQPEVPPLPHHKKQKALKRKAATLMKMVQAGNTKTLPPEQSRVLQNTLHRLWSISCPQDTASHPARSG